MSPTLLVVSCAPAFHVCCRLQALGICILGTEQVFGDHGYQLTAMAIQELGRFYGAYGVIYTECRVRKVTLNVVLEQVPHKVKRFLIANLSPQPRIEPKQHPPAHMWRRPPAPGTMSGLSLEGLGSLTGHLTSVASCGLYLRCDYPCTTPPRSYLRNPGGRPGCTGLQGRLFREAIRTPDFVRHGGVADMPGIGPATSLEQGNVSSSSL